MSGDLGFPDGELDGVRIDRSGDYAGVPDAYQRTWVPHRMVYIDNADGHREGECAFCAAPRKSDEDGLIVHRGRLAFVLMNLYPYNSGHLLVCPYRHVDMYDKLDAGEVAEIGALTQRAMRVLLADGNVSGFNIGMNQGQVAGAGIAGHLHQHIVPRWRNDSNFMPIIARTKPMPQLLGDLRARLEAEWDRETRGAGAPAGHGLAPQEPAHREDADHDR